MNTPGVQTMLGAAGACPEIRFQGQTWRVGHPTQRAKAVLEELVAAKAVAEVRSLRDALPTEAYVETFRELTTSLSAGDYRTWGPGWQRVVFAGGNAHLFLLALLRENHPHATENDSQALAASEPEQVAAALARVVPGFFSLLLEGLPLPAEKRAELKAILGELASRLAPSTAREPSTPASVA